LLRSVFRTFAVPKGGMPTHRWSAHKKSRPPGVGMTDGVTHADTCMPTLAA